MVTDTICEWNLWSSQCAFNLSSWNNNLKKFRLQRNFFRLLFQLLNWKHTARITNFTQTCLSTVHIYDFHIFKFRYDICCVKGLLIDDGRIGLSWASLGRRKIGRQCTGYWIGVYNHRLLLPMTLRYFKKEILPLDARNHQKQVARTTSTTTIQHNSRRQKMCTPPL